MKQYGEVQMRLLAEQTNSANVLLNLWPSNSKGEIMYLWLSFFCSYYDKLSRYDAAFNDSAWAAVGMQSGERNIPNSNEV